MSVTERDVVYVGFDSSGNPSGINVFQAADVVPEKHGGTGVSSFDELNLTASSLTAVSAVSSLYVSALSGVNGMPYPPPFGYIQLTSDDVASVDEKKVGYSNTPTTIVTDGITWDDTNKYFVADFAGTYEVLGVIILEGGSTLVNMSVQRNGADILVGQPRVHSTVDPLEHTIRAVFTMTAGQNAGITYDATASNSVKAITGSSVTIKRLK